MEDFLRIRQGFKPTALQFRSLCHQKFSSRDTNILSKENLHYLIQFINFKGTEENVRLPSIDIQKEAIHLVNKI